MTHWIALQNAPIRNGRNSARECSSSLTSTTHFGRKISQVAVHKLVDHKLVNFSKNNVYTRDIIL